MQIESFGTQPLQQVVPAYVYGQFSDDPDIQAFFSGLNTEAQGYLRWFLSTPLSIYTLPNINGPFLDWIGNGIYGIQRPVVSSVMSTATAAYNTQSFDVGPYGVRKVKSTGSVTIVNDDIYKRVMTWSLYLGDGRQMSTQWLRRRVARFIFGANGTDIKPDYFQQISISRAPSGLAGAFGTGPYNMQAYDTRVATKRLTRHSLQISVPAGQIGQLFQQLLNQGLLPLPFQVKFSVIFH